MGQKHYGKEYLRIDKKKKNTKPQMRSQVTSKRDNKNLTLSPSQQSGIRTKTSHLKYAQRNYLQRSNNHASWLTSQ